MVALGSESDVEQYAIDIIRKEAASVAQLEDHIRGGDFEVAAHLCRICSGNIIVSGIGKSGIIAQKISATLASLGRPSWWMHPNDAEHGDIGNVTERDVVILLSNSGETAEIIRLAKQLQTRGCTLVGMIGHYGSTLETLVNGCVHLGKVEEAGTVKLIPTSSTTAALAMGDALALAIVGKDYTIKEFSQNHPGGNIGLRMTPVAQMMRKGDDCPMMKEGSLLTQAIIAITKARSGSAIVINEEGIISGLITDGDLRRHLTENQYQIGTTATDSTYVEDCMTRKPIVIYEDATVGDALELCGTHQIGDLPVLDGSNYPLGMISLKDLTRLVL